MEQELHYEFACGNLLINNNKNNNNNKGKKKIIAVLDQNLLEDVQNCVSTC